MCGRTLSESFPRNHLAAACVTITHAAMIAMTPIPERQAERRFARVVLLLIILGFGLVMLAGLTAVAVMVRGEDQTRWVDHTFQVEREASTIRLALEEMRSSRRAHALRLQFDSGANYDQAVTAPLHRHRSCRRAHRRQSRPATACRGTSPVVPKARQRVPRVDGTGAPASGRRRARSAADRPEGGSLGAPDFGGGARAARRARGRARPRNKALLCGLFATALLLTLVAAGSIWVILRYTAICSVARRAARSQRQSGRTRCASAPPISSARTRKSSASPISSATICVRRSST
jgi:hypothetical protein